MALTADLVLTECEVLTMNLAKSVAEAVAIKDNKIIKVGTTAEISLLIGPRTRVICLKGKTVVPGFIDTHVHVTDFGRLLAWLDLTAVGSVAELQNCVKLQAERTPKNRWILGRGWNESRFLEKRLPNRLDLDAASPNNPVILYHEVAQVCVINTEALKLAKITAQTPDPESGRIEKDATTSEPTGILRDEATNLIWKMVPELAEDELLDLTALACKKIAATGVTSVHWMVLSAVEIGIAQKLHAQGRLPIRVSLLIPAELLNLAGSFKSDDNSVLRIGGILIAADGYLASRTAALFRPYNDDSASAGKLFCSQHEMNPTAAKILARGFQLVIHAMGDKAVDSALTAIEQSLKVTANDDLRPRLEQAAVLNENLIERIKKHNVVVSVQPLVVASEFSVWHAVEHLGAERARWLYPLKTLVGKGVKVTAGSDCPMEPLSPLLGIQAAVTRSCFPEEQVTVNEALCMYTADAAYSSNEEKVKGSIAKGKLADLTVLSHNPLWVPRHRIKEISVELTVIDGKIVFSKSTQNK